MSKHEEQLKRIQDKLQQLLKEHQALKKERQQLQLELNAAHKKIGSQQENLDELKQKVMVLKVGSNEMNDADKKEFEKRINGYLKEIDRAIALLSE